MAIAPVATPYAMALLSVAVEQGSIRSVREQLDKVVGLIGESDDLRIVFSNPTVSETERMAVVDVLSTRLGLSRTSRNFLMLLAEKRRLGLLPDIAQVFGQLADAQVGVVRARVLSSASLNVTQATRLKNTLAEMTGKTVVVTNDVDPDLIGGMRVEVGGKVYDTSVATQLRKIREAILEDI